ncbi:5-hydroxytryptamine receptor 3A-like isoform X2 [Acipenser ruthenus]|uniref:5-hydroxytryptamine receptor 3A-like isoform X2 n=1 Tax=Acipenser ruthenus TaxID=7906 RepID=UPI002740C8C5|nr:5-hydroxytryptamine receptor 3A-like isoform X2 [Acipenser ruthenus]
MSLAVLLTLAIGCMHCAGVCGAAGEDLVLLGQRLTQGYVKRFRPVLHWDQPVTVYLDLSLYSILDLQEKEEKLTLQLLFGQRWQDEYLSWDPSQFDGLSHFTLPASSVWTPDVTIKEALSEKTSVAVPYVSVTPQGWVRLSQPLVVVLRCSLAMFRFPFDIQKCNITFGPSLHTVDDVKIALERHASAVFNESQSFSSHGEWELLSIQTYSFNETMENRTYSRIAFEVVMGRCPMFYVVNLIVPSALVMLIDLVGFGIPAESGERIPFKVTLLFGYTVFLVLVNDILPPFKHATPVLVLSTEKEPWSGGELLDALREVEAEVREVGAEVRLTLERGRTHRACLELMDTLDTLCFCVYLTLMAAFVLAITGLWLWGHEHY